MAMDEAAAIALRRLLQEPEGVADPGDEPSETGPGEVPATSTEVEDDDGETD
jgi:hypothetical protein